jgi:hypothetical protein
MDANRTSPPLPLQVVTHSTTPYTRGELEVSRSWVGGAGHRGWEDSGNGTVNPHLQTQLRVSGLGTHQVLSHLLRSPRRTQAPGVGVTRMGLAATIPFLSSPTP